MLIPRFVFAGLVALVLMLGSATVARAQSSNTTAAEIQEMLEQRDRQIKAILKGGGDTYTDEQRAELKELINGLIDFESLAKMALGVHWDDLSTEQRKDFVDVFRDVVRANSMRQLGVYNSEVTYGQIDVQGDSAYVRTRTKYEGRTTSVDYVLGRKNGQWLAEDIRIDDVSLAEGYEQYESIVTRHGFDALMKSLRKKRDELEKKS